jgi:phenylalanyl-tRNA synthetase beta chain
MRVSLKWLKELVEVDLGIEELAERLDMTGTAVESVELIGEGLDGVVVGSVLTREKHPDADRLSCCTVDVGADEPLEIVCGADNFAPGDKVPVALVGSKLPNGMEIKKSKIRGVTSHGMMCSPIELGTGADASGLMILPGDAPVGRAFGDYMDVGDAVFDLEITPNRPDCLSVAGIAREVAAVTDKEASWPGSVPEETGTPANDVVAVEIADGELCPRYTARVVRDVSIGPSPAWLAERVTAAGARPINNIVDATNYVMFELGQPIHAFDMDALGVADGKTTILVRPAEDGERFTTLDDQERVLSSDMIVIADPSGSVALAGVMGGAATEVSEKTTNVLLESAAFDPAHVSRTSRSLGLISEASSRMEKRVDPAGCAAAADRVAALVAEVTGGTVAPGIVDAHPEPATTRELTLRLARVNSFLGTELALAEVTGILRRLGLEVSADLEGVLTVTVPTFRPDLEREADLIEEVVRVHGMTQVTSSLPGGRERVGGLTDAQRWRERVGASLRGAGLNETMTYSFIDPSDADRLGWELASGELMVELLNPMSVEQSVMRWTLAPGLLRSVANNLNRGVPDVHLYEVGTVFLTEDGRKLPREWQVVGGVLSGSWARPSWNDPGAELGFFDGKGAIESVMEGFQISEWEVDAEDLPWLQPGRSARVLVGVEPIGWLGEVHPHVLEAYEVDVPVTLFELDLDALIESAVAITPYEEIPRHPAVHLDIALVMPTDIEVSQVEELIRDNGGAILESARLFDVYQGQGVPDGQRSLAFALTYRAEDRTLTDDEVQKVHDRIVKKVCVGCSAEVRS